MTPSRPIRCEFCGKPTTNPPPTQQRLCPSCDALSQPLLTLHHDAFEAREVMINQHAGEPRRKLLELRNHSVVVFFSDRLEITALEIEAKGDPHILRWNQKTGGAEYLVRNLGKGYGNRDELIPQSGFDYAGLHRDLTRSRVNLTPALVHAMESILDDPIREELS